MSEPLNVLVLMTDQHSAHLLGCAGNPDVHTPNLDRLAATGTRFERAYVPFPLCVPSRASLITGRYPHELGITSNTAGSVRPGVLAGSLGHVFASAGYDCAYGGKWHAVSPDVTPEDGFTPVHRMHDTGLADSCGRWLRARRDNPRPFLLVASFDEPHTICEFARFQPLPYGDLPSTELDQAPNLPANFGHQPYEPQALRFEQQANEPMYGTGAYTPDDWRRYRHAYARLVERADARVGEVLDALAAAGLAENTVVVFTSDHGDGDGAHAWNQKSALYEEIIRVPFIVRWPGHGTGGQVISDGPVCTGLDLLPTLCDLTGVPAPAGLAGRSVRAAVETGTCGDDRTVVVETGFERDGRTRTLGRAVVGARYKYVVYSWGRWREQLHDLHTDPSELINLAVEARHNAVLERSRAQLLDWCRANGDETFLRRLVLPASIEPAERAELFSLAY